MERKVKTHLPRSPKARSLPLARVLQVEVPSHPDTSLFELDFDHSFMDYGQSDVPSELILPRAR